MMQRCDKTMIRVIVFKNEKEKEAAKHKLKNIDIVYRSKQTTLLPCILELTVFVRSTNQSAFEQMGIRCWRVEKVPTALFGRRWTRAETVNKKKIKAFEFSV